MRPSRHFSPWKSADANTAVSICHRVPRGVKNLPEFWNALDQRLKPSLNYVVTLAMMIDDIPADTGMAPVVSTSRSKLTKRRRIKRRSGVKAH